MTQYSKLVDAEGQPIPLASFGRSMGGEIASWKTSPKLTDESYLPIKGDADSKAEDLIQNHGIASGSVQTHVDNIVGHQFRLNAKPLYQRLGISHEDARLWGKDAEAAFLEYAEDIRCYIDAEERRTFTMLIRDAVRGHLTTGEVMATAEWINHDGSPYRTAVKMISPHRVCNPNGAMDTNSLRGGVKLNKYGAAKAYCVRQASDNNFGFGIGLGGIWKEVKVYKPWGRKQFVHIFDPNGDSNCRGTTGFISVLSRLKMLDKYQGVRLQNAIINAMYAATIETELDAETAFQIIGGETNGAKKLLDYMGTVEAYHSSANITMNGVKIPHLMPGEKFKLNAPGNVDNGFAAFEKSILRYVAAGLNISYEQLAKDYSQVSYSSARASLMNEWRYFLGRRAIIAARYASEIYQLWLEEAINLNVIKLPRKAKFNFYEARAAWSRASWIGAGRLAIDGVKEVKEALLRIEGGLSTYEKELSIMGEDYQEIFEQQVRETEERRAAGLPPPSWASAEQFAPTEGQENGNTASAN